MLWMSTNRRVGCSLPLLQLWWWNEACGPVLGVLQLSLPPVVVVLGDDLNDVAHSEANACLLTGNEVIFGWVILKLGTNVDLEERDSQTSQFGLKHKSICTGNNRMPMWTWAGGEYFRAYSFPKIIKAEEKAIKVRAKTMKNGQTSLWVYSGYLRFVQLHAGYFTAFNIHRHLWPGDSLDGEHEI